MHRTTVFALLSSLVLAGACGAPESPGAEREAEATAVPEDDGSGAPLPAAPNDASASVTMTIAFDLRGLPHRGPYDVDPSLIESRRAVLVERAREAAGAPAPRFRSARRKSSKG